MTIRVIHIMFPLPVIVALPAIIAMTGACGNRETGRSHPVQKTGEEQSGAIQAGALSQQTETVTVPQPTDNADEVDEFAGLPEPYVFADYNRGRRVFKLCQSCHTIKQGGPHLVGPNLYGVFNRQIGTADGFVYSRAARTANFVWTPEQVDTWLANPRSFLPGNKMSFAGVRRPEDRTAVIAYLMKESGYPDE